MCWSVYSLPPIFFLERSIYKYLSGTCVTSDIACSSGELSDPATLLGSGGKHRYKTPRNSLWRNPKGWDKSNAQSWRRVLQAGETQTSRGQKCPRNSQKTGVTRAEWTKGTWSDQAEEQMEQDQAGPHKSREEASFEGQCCSTTGEAATCHIRIPILELQFKSHCSVSYPAPWEHLGKHKMAQNTGPCHIHGKLRKSCRLLASAWTTPGHCGHFSSKSIRWKTLLPLSP